MHSNNAAVRNVKHTTRHRLLGRRHALTVALAMLIALVWATTAYAGTVSNTGNISHEVVGVTQGGDLATFAKNAPITTIYMDPSKFVTEADITPVMQSKIKATQLKWGTAADGKTWDTKGFGTATTDYYWVYYDPTASGAAALLKDTDNYFEGDLFSFTFKDAAVLQDGTTKDVVLTYSNLHIFLDNNLTSAFTGKVQIASGNVLIANNDTDNPTGIQVDVKVQVVDTYGTPVAGTFLAGVTDIDVLRGNTGFCSTIYNASSQRNFSEQIRINSGTVSDIFVPASSIYYCEVINEPAGVYQGAVRLIARISDADTYRSGFLTAADSVSGLSMSWFGGGRKINGPFKSFLLASDIIWHRIVSSSTSGGSINTTIGGNAGGDLSDESGVIGPDGPYHRHTAVVTDGKSVTYTMGPDENFFLGSLTVDGTVLDISGLTTTSPKTFTIGGNNRGTLKLVEQGNKTYYTFEFDNNSADHTIHVSWAPSYAFYKTWAGIAPDADATISLTATPYVRKDDGSFEPYAPTDTVTSKHTPAPVQTFTVSASHAGVTTSTSGNLTTWQVVYPSTGGTTNSWPALPFEVTTTNDKGEVTAFEQLYWFVNETSTSAGWIFAGYDNDNAAVHAIYPNHAEAQASIGADNTHAYLSLHNAQDSDSQGGRIANVCPVVVQATKTWEDQSNAFDTRENVYLHLDAYLDESSTRTTYDGRLEETTTRKLVGEDVLPPLQAGAMAGTSADTAAVAWGAFDNEGTPTSYTGSDGTKVYATADAAKAALAAAYPNSTYDNTYMSHIYIPASDTTKSFFVNQLPAYDEDGNPYYYVVRETDGAGIGNAAGNVLSSGTNATDPTMPLMGYTTSLDTYGTGEDAKNYQETTEDGLIVHTYSVTNTLDTVDVAVTKKWVDTDNTTHTEDDIKNSFHLFRVVGGAPVEVTDVAPTIHAVSGDSSTWTYSVTGLPRYVRHLGTVQEATYYVKEYAGNDENAPVDGYLLPLYSNSYLLDDLMAILDGAKTSIGGETPATTGEEVVAAATKALQQARENRSVATDRALSGGTITNVALPTGTATIAVSKQLTGATTLSSWGGAFTFALKDGNGTQLGDAYKVSLPNGGDSAEQTVKGTMSSTATASFARLSLKAFVEDGDTNIYAVGSDGSKLAGVSALGTLSGPSGTSHGSLDAVLFVSETAPSDVATGLSLASDHAVSLYIADKGDGTLDVQTSPATGVVMHNRHAPGAATAQIALQKMLTGRDIKDGEFSFTATYMPDYASTGVDEATFSQITAYDAEVTDAVLRMSDEQLVRLNDLANEEPSTLARIRAGESVGLGDELESLVVAFTDDQIRMALLNTSDALKATLRRLTDGQKAALREQLRLWEGSAASHEVTGSVTPVENDSKTAKGNLSLSLAKAGTYTYTVAENIPADAVNGDGVAYQDASAAQRAAGGFVKNGVTYDHITHTVTVTVEKEASGSLKAATTYESSATAATFANTYSPTATLHLGARKNLVGKQWDDNMWFQFTLAATGGKKTSGDTQVTPEPTPASSLTQTVRRDTDEHQCIWDIAYTLSDVGNTYTYTIQEAALSYGGMDTNEWSNNDTTEHAITVAVKDAGDGTLTLAVNGDSQLSHYVDESGETIYYQRIDNTGKGSDIRAVKQMDDDVWPSNAIFELTMTAEKGYAEVGDGATETQNNTDNIVAPLPSDADKNGTVVRTATKTDPEVIFATFGAADFDTSKEPFSSMSGGAKVKFTYTIKETIPSGVDTNNKKSGITYDMTTYKAFLTVTKNGDSFTSEVTYQKAGDSQNVPEPTFTNKYESSGEAVITAKKLLEGRNITNYSQFTFTLKDTDGNTVKGKDNAAITQIAAGTNGIITLPTLGYTQNDTNGSSQPVTRTYYLYEDLPAGVTASNPTKDGITYDVAAHPVTVTLSDNKDGTIKTTVSPEQNDLVITNTYNATNEQTFGVKKLLAGRPISRVGFSFQIEPLKSIEATEAGEGLSLTAMEFGTTTDDLVAKAAVPMPEEDTVAVTAQVGSYRPEGAANFGTIGYTSDDLANGAETSYCYRISEVVPADRNDAIAYAPVTYYAKVTINDAGNGTLTKAVEVYQATATTTDEETTYTYTKLDSGANDALEFQNTYTATGAATIAPIKQINGRSWTPDDSFSFTVEPCEDNNAYSWTGTKNTGNKVASTSVPLPGNSVVTSRSLPTSSNTATGTAVYTSDIPVTGQRSAEYSASNTDGFGPITFTEGMLKANASGILEGEFCYKITENTNDLADTGFKQTPESTTAYYVRVHVTDDRFGTLVTTVHYYSDAAMTTEVRSPVFQNTYEAKGTASISVTKHLVGRKWASTDSFAFDLSMVGTDMPLPGGEGATKLTLQGTNDSNGDVTGRYPAITIPWSKLTSTASAGQLVYSDNSAVAAGTHYGVFTYQIREDGSNPIAGLSYDTSTVYVRVLAIDDHKGKIDCTITYYRDSSYTDKITETTGEGEGSTTADAASARFANTYSEIVSIPIAKEVDGDEVWDTRNKFDFAIEATGENAAAAPLPKDAEGTTVTTITATKDKPKPSFDNLTFTLDDVGKTFVYKIYEVEETESDPGKAQLVKYDTKPITATFAVTKDSAGNLVVTPTYTKDGQTVAANTLTFTNTYIKNAKAKLYVYKRIVGGEWPTGDAGSFAFAVNALGGAHAPQESKVTVGNDTDHHKVEDDVVITAEDFADVGADSAGSRVKDFVYEIAEDLTDEQKVTYAGSKPVYAKVTATLDDSGTVEIKSVTYWHTYIPAVVDDEGTVTTPARVSDKADVVGIVSDKIEVLETDADGVVANSAYTGTIAVQMTNLTNTAATAPAQVVIEKEVTGSAYTWGTDSFSFTMTPADGKAPAIEDAITIGDSTSAAVEEYGTNPLSHATAVNIPVKLSDLDRDARDNPIETTFYYELREQTGTTYGMRYASDPLYLAVTATPSIDERTNTYTLSLTYATYQNYDATTGAASNLIAAPENWPSTYGYAKFTNTYGLVDLKIQKLWHDDGAASRPKNIVLQVSLANTNEMGDPLSLNSVIPEGKAITYTTTTNGTAGTPQAFDTTTGVITMPSTADSIAIAGLPAYDASEQLRYAVDELEGGSEYRATVEYETANTPEDDATEPATTTWTIEVAPSNATGAVRVTNTQLITVSGKKVWQDDDNAAGVRPDAVVVALLRDGVFTANFTVTSDEQDWGYSFANLPAYDADGKAYSYNVMELGTPDEYESKVEYGVTGESEGTTTTWTDTRPTTGWTGLTRITNTLKASTAATFAPEVSKALSGRAITYQPAVEDDPATTDVDERKPASGDQFTFTIAATGGNAESAPMPAASTALATQKVTDNLYDAEFGTITIEGDKLVRNDETGLYEATFTYQITEDIPAGAVAKIGDAYVAYSDASSAYASDYKGTLRSTVASEDEKANASHTWVYRGVRYSNSAYTLRLHAQRAGVAGAIQLTHTYTDAEGNVVDKPIFQNTYDATGLSWGHVIKHINGRDFGVAAMGESESDEKTVTLRGDAFSFYLTGVGEAVMNPTSGTLEEVNETTRTHTTKPMNYDGNGVLVVPGEGAAGNGVAYGASAATTGSDMAILTGEGEFRLSDLKSGADGVARGTFVYEVREAEPTTASPVSYVEYRTEGDTQVETRRINLPIVSDLQYDNTVLYLCIQVVDNGDGTLSVTNSYWKDAACTQRLTVGGKVPQVRIYRHDVTDGDVTHKAGEIAVAGASEEDTELVDAAYFQNTRTIDIEVNKKWVDESDQPVDPIDNVTGQLYRYPVKDPNAALSNTVGDDNYVPANINEWEPVKSGTMLINGFYFGSDEAANAYNTAHSLTGDAAKKKGDLNPDGLTVEFKNVDLFERTTTGELTGREYVFRIVETTHSQAYTTTYAIKWADEGKGTSAYSDENANTLTAQGTFLVKNTIKATNEANVAAVKQLIGREWNGTDKFAFTLTPVGKAEYGLDNGLQVDNTVANAGVKLVANSGTDSDFPMPENPFNVAPLELVDATKAIATKGTADVAEGEHLARFGSITFDLTDLTYNPTTGRMQGDFYYLMTEDKPDGADANHKYQGITYDTKPHTVHIHVEENRTNQLSMRVVYDQSDPLDLNSGTQFTPVYTNHYTAEGSTTAKGGAAAVQVWKQKLGAPWAEGESYDFTMQPLAGAAFADADHANEFVDGDELDGNKENDITSDKAVHTKAGQHKIRLTVTADEATEANNATTEGGRAITRAFPTLKFTQDDLTQTVTADNVAGSWQKDGVVVEEGTEDAEYVYTTSGTNAIVYSSNAGEGKANERVRAGIKYGRFVYAIAEVAGTDTNIQYDPDTEYARITAIDLENGTIDLVIEYFEDRYCTIKRVESDGRTNFPGAPFTNAAKHSIWVQKDWMGVPDADVTVHLERVGITDDRANGKVVDARATEFVASDATNNTVVKVQTGVDDDDKPVYTWCEVTNEVLSDLTNATSGGATVTDSVLSGVNLVTIGTNGSTRRYLVLDNSTRREWESLEATQQQTLPVTDFAKVEKKEYAFNGLLSRIATTDGEGKITYTTYVYRAVESTGNGFTTTYPHQITSGLSSEDEWGTKATPLEVRNKSVSTETDSVSPEATKVLSGRDILNEGDIVKVLGTNSVTESKTISAAEADNFQIEIEPLGIAQYEDGNIKKGANGAYEYAGVTKDGDTYKVGNVTVPVPASTTASLTRNANLKMQGMASFGAITFSNESLAHDTAKGIWRNDFIYKLSEVIPEGAVAKVDDTTYVAYKDKAKALVQDYTDDNDVVHEPADATDEQRANASLTWVYKGVSYDNSHYYLVVHVQNDGSGIEATASYLDSEFKSITDEEPTFTNTYHSKVMTRGWVVKRIYGREWDAFTAPAFTKGNDGCYAATDGTLNVSNTDGVGGDAYQFTITGIGGAAMHPTTSGLVDNVWTTPVMTCDNNTNANPGVAVDAQKLSDNEVAMRTGEGLLTDDGLNADGSAYYLYAISEKPSVTYSLPTGKSGNTVAYGSYDLAPVPNISYDANTMYLRISAHDNWDGTISYVNDYFADAGCTQPINTQTVWVKGNDKDRLVSATELADKDEAARSEAGYRKVYAAFFNNYRTIDIPVTKEWVGTPVEDVTVRLEEALFPLDAESALIAGGDNYVADHVGKNDDVKATSWFAAGRTMTLMKGDFATNDDEAAAQTRTETDGSTTTWTRTTTTADGKTTVAMSYLNSNFNKSLPLYVMGDGRNGTTAGAMYRAVYRLVEDNTSDAYKTEYRSIQPGETDESKKVKPGDQVFVDSGTMVVTNTTQATNTASIAAVKQLVGRTWLDSDSFEFRLEPLGKAAYYTEADKVSNAIPAGKKVGDIKTTTADGKTTAELVAGSAATIPVPVADETRLATIADRIASTKATKATSVVGEGERLARFGAISFSVADLEYDSTDRHYQGDFYYRMTEVVPTDKKGITYDTTEHIVHVRVRENRTDELQVTVAYDETDQSDASTGTQFTPVFTNTYDALGTKALGVDKYVMGRTWNNDDTFDFEIRAMGGAPFAGASYDLIGHDYTGDGTDWRQAYTNNKLYYDSSESGTAAIVPSASDLTLPRATRDNLLDAGWNIIVSNGGMQMRMKASDKEADADHGTKAFDTMRWRLSDLNWTVGANGAKDSADTNGPAVVMLADGTTHATPGLRYARFTYAVSEVGTSAADLSMDEDTEYLIVTVIDKGDGTLDCSVGAYEDRYGNTRRFVPDANGTSSGAPATNAAFVNQLLRKVTVEKEWHGAITGSVTVSLQASTDGTTWSDTGYSHTFHADDMRPTGELDSDDLAISSATFAFEGLPAYANAQDDDLNLNDLWVRYRVKEATGTGYVQWYAEPRVTAAEPSGYNAGTPETLKVVNTSNDQATHTGTARVSLLKEFTGRSWANSDEFTFVLEPVGKGVYDNSGNLIDGSYVMTTDETNVVNTAIVPLPSDAVDGKATAKATAGSTRVTDAQRPADFADITIDTSRMQNVNGVWKVDYFYKLTEQVPSTAELWEVGNLAAASLAERLQKVTKDGGAAVTYGDQSGFTRDGNKTYVWIDNDIRYDESEHTVQVHAEYAGSGTVATTVLYDGKAVGSAIPVFANVYEQVDTTSIEVHKVWNDDGGYEAKRPESVTFRLYADGNDTGRTVTLRAPTPVSGTWTATFADVPVHSDIAKQNKITYTVGEDDADALAKIGYTSDTSKANEAGGYTITNSYSVPGEPTDDATLTVTKVWHDPNGKDRAPGADEVTIWAVGRDQNNVVRYALSDKLSASDNPSENWTKTWTNLRSNLTYEVYEEPVDGYTSEVSKDGDRTFTVTNTEVRSKGMEGIEFSKTWDDDADRDGLRDHEAVELRLERRVGDGSWQPATYGDLLSGTTIKRGNDVLDWSGKDRAQQVSVALTGMDAEGFSIAGLPKATSELAQAPAVAGTSESEGPVAQTESEGDAGEAVTASDGSAAGDDEQDAQKSVAASEQGSADDEPANDEADAADAGQTDAAGQPADAQAAATPGVSAEGTPSASEGDGSILAALSSLFVRTAFADEVVTQADGDAATANDQPIWYRVVEYHRNGTDWAVGAPKGYEAYTVLSETGVYEVHNVHVPATTSFAVHKVWNDSNNEAGARPESVSVQLKAGEAAQGEPVTLSEANEWSHTWNDLYVYEAGKQIAYTAVEQGVADGYTVAYAGESSQSYVITNTYNGGTASITATKRWLDADGNEVRPGAGTHTPAVTLTLYKNGNQAVAEQTVPDAAEATEAQMSHTWDGLAAYENGVRVTYTVTESVNPAANAFAQSTEDRTAEDGTIVFVNRLGVASGSVAGDGLVKITYVDYLMGEDGLGGSLQHGKEIVTVPVKLEEAQVREEMLTAPAGTSFTSGLAAAARETEDDGDGAVVAQAEDSYVVPADPQHEGFVFTGWTRNKDVYGDYTMVAHYRRTPLASYVDGQTGEVWDAQPGDPEHDGLRFAGWKLVTDAAGNQIYVAQYEVVGVSAGGEQGENGEQGAAPSRVVAPPYPASAPLASGASPRPLASTGDATHAPQALLCLAAAGGLLAAAGLLRRRRG